MSRKVLKTPYAVLDLAEQAEFIAADNIDAALAFLEAAERDFALLAQRPRAGVRRKIGRKELGEVRSWPIGGFENHVIFYRPIAGSPGGVEILRVLYGSRDVGLILNK